MSALVKSSYLSKGDVQAAKHENANQGNLASKINMKLPNHWYRQAKNHDVSKERQGTISCAADGLILAFSVWDSLIVKESYWGTDCEVDEEGGDSPANGVGHVGPGEHFELSGWEETHVEEQDGGFDANQCRCIGSLQSECDLESCQ
jgi:hypothetical protein